MRKKLEEETDDIWIESVIASKTSKISFVFFVLVGFVFESGSSSVISV